MGSLSPALELLRTLVARLGAASSSSAEPLTAAQADAKLQGVLRAVSRAVGDDDAAHVVHAALFAAWQPVAACGACVARPVCLACSQDLCAGARAVGQGDSDWPAWPSSAAPRADALLSTRDYSSLIARNPFLVLQLVDHLL